MAGEGLTAQKGPPPGLWALGEGNGPASGGLASAPCPSAFQFGAPLFYNAFLEMKQAVKIIFTFTWGRVEFASLQPEPQEVSGAGHVLGTPPLVL